MSENSVNSAHQGVSLVLAAVLLGSMQPVVVNPSAIEMSPFWIAAISSGLALIPITYLMFHRRLWKQVKNPIGLYYSCLAGILIGVLYYSLIHWGSYHTSPQNASILVCLEMFTAMLLLHRSKNDGIAKHEILGAMLLFMAVIILFLPNSSNPGIGDLVLLLSTFFTPIGNYFMKIARRQISSVTIMCIRTIISALVLSLIALISSSPPSIQQIHAGIIPLFFNGIMILGVSKILWIEGIHRIAITKASSLAATAPILTFIFSWIFLAKYPSLAQLCALPITVAGVLLIVIRKKDSFSKNVGTKA